MDQTIFAQKTKEEQKLSAAIYRNLHILSVCQKSSKIITDEFRLFLKPDVFVKPNTKAFPHIYHFLLTLLDPIELKKRIFWPCFDKTAETRFRSDVLNWLNSLNRQYSWGFDEFKMHMVVLPGGMNFMKVTFELILLVMKQVIKTSPGAGSADDTYNDNDVCNYTTKNSSYIRQNQINKLEAARLFSRNLQKKTIPFEEYNRSIHQHTINRINKLHSNETTKIFNWNWKHTINNLTMLEIKQPIEQTQQMNEKMKILINFIESSYSLAEFVEFDKLAIKNCQDKLVTLFQPHQILQFSNEFEFNYNNIGKTFQNLLPNILDLIFQFSYPSNDQLQKENDLLEDLYAKWQKIQLHKVNIEMNLTKRKSEYLSKLEYSKSTPTEQPNETIVNRELFDERNECTNLNTVRFKVMETPPLSQFVLPSTVPTTPSASNHPQRLSLLFDESNVTKLIINNNQTQFTTPFLTKTSSSSVQKKSALHFPKINSEKLLNNITKQAASSHLKIRKPFQNNHPSQSSFLISPSIQRPTQVNSFNNNNNNRSSQNYQCPSNGLSSTDPSQSSDGNSSMMTAFHVLISPQETKQDENLFDTSDTVLKDDYLVND